MFALKFNNWTSLQDLSPTITNNFFTRSFIMMWMILSYTSIMTETLNFYNPLPIAQTVDDNKHINDNITDEDDIKYS